MPPRFHQRFDEKEFDCCITFSQSSDIKVRSGFFLSNVKVIKICMIEYGIIKLIQMSIAHSPIA